MLAGIINFIGTLSLSFLQAFQIIKRDKIVSKLYIESFIQNLKKIVWNALPITTLIIAASAVIYSIHVAPDFSSRGLNIYFGGIVALALIRECVPVMGSLAIVTYYCTGKTAEIGSMKVTEQIDAMRIIKVNPEGYLLLPMLLSGLLGFPIVVIIGVFIGLIVSFISTTLISEITLSVFTTSILNSVVIKDIMLALLKGATFGFVVTLISYTCGITTIGGARAVGNSTKLSVVVNFAVILILDYIITALWL